MEHPSKISENKQSFFQSTTAKLLMIGLLTLVLLIPLEFVKNLIEERTLRKKEVVEEVTNLWGKKIEFYGPILQIPYKSYEQTTITDPKTKTISFQSKEVIKNAYFFPHELNNNSLIKKNTKLKRGIYNPIVYTANMKFNGSFYRPNFEKLEIKAEDILWDKASVLIKTTNLKSIKSNLKINLHNHTFALESNENNENDHYGVLSTPPFNFKELANKDNLSFNFKMEYNGSDEIMFIPIGKTTKVSMDSDWNSPSYVGAFAANDKTKKGDTTGFHVDWKVIDINRSFPQEYLDNIPKLDQYAFGVKLIETVNEYQQSERASKYGFLVIGLTFLVFFLIQSISKISIHIFQYTMLGLALIMFYTLLISITEHSSFALAYCIGSVAIIGMIVLYSISILKNQKFPAFIGLSLTALYSFIYTIIQLENYALLVGSIGLFIILGLVMYFSRKIDWSK